MNILAKLDSVESNARNHSGNKELVSAYNNASYKLEIVRDDNPMDPREWDNVGTMACWHDRYRLGDVQPGETPEEYLEKLSEDYLSEKEKDNIKRMRGIIDSWWYYANSTGRIRLDKLEQEIEKIHKIALGREYFILPLYLYDHGGITMRAAPFSCEWDCGQVGFIYVSREKANAKLPGASDDSICEVLRNEVNDYARYLEGDCWGWDITDENGNIVDSCCGYYGYDYAKSEGNIVLSSMIREAA